MPEYHERPSGARLDHLVMWAMHHMESPIYTGELQFFVALKAGRVGIDDNDNQFYSSISRSLKRLEQSGVIRMGRADGWEITEVPQ